MIYKSHKPIMLPNRTYKACQMFKLMKCTMLRKKYGNFEFVGSNTSQNCWDGGIKRLEKVSVTKINNWRNILQLTRLI